jgi:hypothetical protein
MGCFLSALGFFRGHGLFLGALPDFRTHGLFSGHTSYFSVSWNVFRARKIYIKKYSQI